MVAETTEAAAAVEGVGATEIAGSVEQVDMSFLGLFMQADIIVQGVMLLLLGASLWCWSIVFEKVMLYRTVRSRATQFQESFWSSDDLDACYQKMRKLKMHPMLAVFMAGMQEWYGSKVGEMSLDAYAKRSVLERIEKVMMVARNREQDKLEGGIGFLATAGATAPFIGLFGTVWGIMNSFQNIAAQKSTNLAVVAPGIAEALLATAIGLVVAIPAVMAYNKLQQASGAIAGDMEDFSTEFLALLSRQLDAKRGGSSMLAA